MTGFEESKTATLKRLPVLRFMNAIGMTAWREDRYGGAEQRLRMIHPLSWIWLVIAILIGVFNGGVPEVIKELKTLWRNQCVWW